MIVLKILSTVDLNNQRLGDLTGELFTDGLGDTKFQSLKMKGLQSSQLNTNLKRCKHIYIYTFVSTHMKNRYLMYNLKCLLKARVGRNLKEHLSNKNTDYYT